MNTESIVHGGDEPLVAPELPSLTGVLSMPGFLYAQLQAAHRIGKQAARLYAMSDAQLSSQGLTREGIRECLIETIQD